jgi:IclR family KDG regulon transcriptional repressor
MGETLIMENRTYSAAKTVIKAFKLLEELAEKQTAKASELAQELGWTRSNLYRMLETLQSIGYVEKDLNSQYRLSIKLFLIGNSVRGIEQLSIVARPYMKRLGELSQETINLAIMYEDRVLYIEKVESPHYLRLDQPTGKTDPLYCTALGKVLLSGLTEVQLKEVLNSLQMSPYTKRTIIDPEVLTSVVRNVRKNGYAMDLEELSAGIHCVAAPIWDHGNKVIAAVSISGPNVRLTEQRIDELLSELITMAGKISKMMGSTAHPEEEKQPE